MPAKRKQTSTKKEECKKKTKTDLSTLVQPQPLEAIQLPLLSLQEFKELHLNQLKVTPQQQKEFATGAIQKSKQWLELKEKRLTSSQFGAAAYHDSYKTPQQLLKEKLWPAAGGIKGAALDWGNCYEDVAKYKFEQFMKVWTLGQQCKRAGKSKDEIEKAQNDMIQTIQKYEAPFFQSPAPAGMLASASTTSTASGSTKLTRYIPYSKNDIQVTSIQVVVSLPDPWLGFSPDGVVQEPDGSLSGLEIKCPYSQVLTARGAPHSHYDQMQMSGYINQFKYYYYFQYTPKFSLLRRFTVDYEYCERILKPKLQSWYMDQYIPGLYYKLNGMTKPGETVPSLDL